MAGFYGISAMAFAHIVHEVLILEWHDWQRTLFGWLPFGQVVGWQEVIIFSGLAIVSIALCFREIQKI